MVFDNFLAVGETKPVYGRDCECGSDVDEKGRVIKVCCRLSTFVLVVSSAHIFKFGSKIKIYLKLSGIYHFNDVHQQI